MTEPERNSDAAYLHPIFREKARRLLAQLAAEGIPFRLFEGYRSPERQQYLYAQGRTRPGPIVTRAQPWTSYHQYGLAADFVLFIRGEWSWDKTGPNARYWTRLAELGAGLGLERISFELPHLQLAGLKIADLTAGQYPSGGDHGWTAMLESALTAWRDVRLAA